MIAVAHQFYSYILLIYGQQIKEYMSWLLSS